MRRLFNVSFPGREIGTFLAFNEDAWNSPDYFERALAAEIAGLIREIKKYREETRREV